MEEYSRDKYDQDHEQQHQPAALWFHMLQAGLCLVFVCFALMKTLWWSKLFWTSEQV